MIIRTQQYGAVETRSFALTDMVRWGYSGLRNVPGTIAAKTVQGIPALHLGARLRAEAVAQLRIQTWRGEDDDAVHVDSWQERFLNRPRANPQQDRFTFWETMEESLAYRNNAWIWKVKDPGGRVLEWYALHPDQVAEGSRAQWIVKTMDGYVDPTGRGPAYYTLDEDTILHVRGHGTGGKRVAPSPIEVFREALAAPINRMRHENRMWQRGTALQQAVEFPPGVTKEKAEEWRDEFDARHSGTDGATTMVVGAGAKVQKIGMTMADAQYVDMAMLTVQDSARIIAVPDQLLMAQLKDRQQIEDQLSLWLRFGLGSELGRIEAALLGDEDLFPSVGRGAGIRPVFKTDGFVRGDLLTEAQIMHLRIQDGTLLPDEARKQMGYPPLPGGVGMIPQVTPVGGAPTINPNAEAVAAQP